MTGLWLLCIPLASAAANQGAAWLGLEGELRVGERVELGLGEEYRAEVFPEGSSELLTEPSVRVEIVDGVAVQGGYRLEVPLESEPVSHRLALDLRLDRRFDVVRIKFRQRYTAGFSDEALHTLRTRLGVELRFDQVRPYLSVEPFVRVSGGARLHKTRVTLGAKIPTSVTDLRLFSHFEQHTDGDRFVVGGLSCKFQAKLERKR